MEQAELWPTRPASHDIAPVCSQAALEPEAAWSSPVVSEVVAREPVDTVIVKEPVAAARPATLSRRFVTRTVTRQTAAPVKPGRHIARFLNVNNAIKAFDQGEDFIRYQQPESGLSKIFRLLKGSAPASNYTSLFF